MQLITLARTSKQKPFKTSLHLQPNLTASLTKKIINRYGSPEKIITDQGTNLESYLIEELSRLVGINKVRSTAYHPEGNGRVEL